MAVIENILTPIAQLFIYLLLGGWVLWMIWWLISRKLFPDFKFTWKYRILGRGYSEKDVEWCMKAVDLQMNDADVLKYMVVEGHSSMKRAKEMVYLFHKIQNKLLKGGVDDGR